MKNNQQQPLISFIVPYFNLPVNMLCECIDSILALPLTPEEREIIIVDDGSDHSPIEQLRPYQKDILYVRQANGGLSVARNTGIHLAKGTYLQFVDSDDLLLPAPYALCIDMARSGKADIVMFDFTETPDVPTIRREWAIVSGTDFMLRNNLHGTACCYLFRRSVLGELRFTPGIYHEDEEFTPHLLIRAQAVCPTKLCPYLYRKRPDSIITSTNVRNKLKRLNDLQSVIVRLSNSADTLPVNDRQAMQRRVAQLTMDYIYKVIIETQSHHYLNRQLERLRQQGLFPLPEKDYTAKYTWFRRLMGNPAGRTLLMRMLPLMTRER